jgi:hypothetical protein
MTYSRKDLEEQALKVIKEKKITFIEDLICYLPCSRPNFYKKKLNESGILKDAIQVNKQIHKQALRVKWLKDGNPTTEIALYKLLGTDEERQILNNNKIEIGNADGKAFEIKGRAPDLEAYDKIIRRIAAGEAGNIVEEDTQ